MHRVHIIVQVTDKQFWVEHEGQSPGSDHISPVGVVSPWGTVLQPAWVHPNESFLTHFSPPSPEGSEDMAASPPGEPLRDQGSFPSTEASPSPSPS